LEGKVEHLAIYQVIIESAPDGVIVVSPDVSAKIVYVNDTLGEVLRIASPAVVEDLVDR
jgi:PAS domain-containing protein